MSHTILLLEDEPLILMDLEFAAQDHGLTALIASTIDEAFGTIAQHKDTITVAVLDVSLGEGLTCFPVAKELDRLGIPFILHSGDLDRHDEKVRELDADLIAKPAPADTVIAGAVAYAASA
ncbi:MAG: response regulator [Erythrobacter sp.]|nr:response regulator [Erythrobacter sp.]